MPLCQTEGGRKNMNKVSIINLPVSIVQPFTFKGRFFSKTFLILSLFLAFSLMIISVVQLNAYIKENYLVQNYEERIAQLNQENKILEVSFSKDNSLNNINNYAQNFEKVTEVEYIKVLEKKLISSLKKFDPDIIGLSAGFDSYIKDFNYMNPGLGFKLTQDSYKKIKEIIKNHKVFGVLEGGYNPESIKDGVKVFMGDI